MYDQWKIPATSEGEAFQRLMGIVRLLRVECPWDREQNHASIRKGMLEEAYEVAEAIDRMDMPNLREELGDVLLQVAFHSILAQEENAFTAVDVINEECEKMICRHPHVFSDEDSKTVDKVLEKWENIKEREHGETSPMERLAGVPRALPALTRSQKIQKRAEQCGFHWEDGTDALTRVAALSKGFIETKAQLSPEDQEETIGDILFATVLAANEAGVDPEEALEKATQRFVERFSHLVQEAEQQGTTVDKVSL